MSDRKFYRRFILLTEIASELDEGEFIKISSPMTVEFEITRNNLAKVNEASFTVYNLGEDTRNEIYKDVWNINDQRAVQFFAGYAEKVGDLLPCCFTGTIRRAYSHRQGTEVRTVIEAFDGNVSLGMPTNGITLPARTPLPVVIDTLAKGMTGVDKVTVGTMLPVLAQRATAMFGDPMEKLSQLTNNGFYIDSGAAYALGPKDVLQGEIILIDKNNGLIGTPKKSEVMVEIEMLFEPRLKPSQYIELKSETEPRFNGDYKVTGLIHRGTISNAICGDCRSIVTLQRLDESSLVYDPVTLEYRTIEHD